MRLVPMCDWQRGCSIAVHRNHPEDISPQDICISIIDGVVDDDQRLKSIGAPSLELIRCTRSDSCPLVIGNRGSKVNSQACFCECLGISTVEYFNVENTWTSPCCTCCLGKGERKCCCPKSTATSRERDPWLVGVRIGCCDG